VSRRPAAADGAAALAGSEPVVELPRLPLQRVAIMARVLQAIAFGAVMAGVALSWELLPLLAARLLGLTPHWSRLEALLLVTVFAAAGFLISYLGFASTPRPHSRHHSA